MVLLEGGEISSVGVQVWAEEVVFIYIVEHTHAVIAGRVVAHNCSVLSCTAIYHSPYVGSDTSGLVIY